MSKRVLFIDRDGTIVVEPSDEQLDSFEKLEFVPGVFRSLSFLRSHTDFEFVMASNQDGLGTPSYPEKDFYPTHNFILNTLKGEGVEFDDLLIDRHFPQDNAPTRKPGTGMFGAYMDGSCDLAGSYVIGDRVSDVQLAANLGAKAILLASPAQAEKMLEGTELFIGAKYETRFGHVVLCGLGGIFVEVLKDVSSGLAPLSYGEAYSMIHSLRGYKILKGTRGQKGINEQKYAEIIVRLSTLLRFATEIKEMDINPLLADENNVVAVDARILIER